jgi:hypothetical protein
LEERKGDRGGSLQWSRLQGYGQVFIVGVHFRRGVKRNERMGEVGYKRAGLQVLEKKGGGVTRTEGGTN